MRRSNLFIEVVEKGTAVEVSKSIEEGAADGLTVCCDTEVILAQDLVDSRASQQGLGVGMTLHDALNKQDGCRSRRRGSLSH